jgi:TonB family protein
MNLKTMLLVVASVLTLAQTPSGGAAGNAPRAQEPATATADAPLKWERFNYPGEEFSVELPEMPFAFQTTRHVNRTLSDSEKMRVFGSYSGGVVFMVVSYDKPRDGETFDDFAGYTREGSLGGLVSKGNVTLDGFAGKEYAQPDGRIAARVFRAKQRAYLLMAFAKTGGDPKVARFLNSFSLDKKASGVAIDEFKAEAARVAQANQSKPADSPGPGIGTGPGRGMGMGRGTGSGAGLGPGRGANTGRVPYEGGGGPGPGSPVDYNRPFRQNEVTSKAVVVYKPAPGYTEEARRDNVTGVVRLRAVLSSKGRVTNISVVKGLPDGLTEKAIHAARYILFLPAQKDGREVSQYVILEYNFNIY